MTKHTPGPWEYFEQKEWGTSGAYYGCVRDKTGLVIVNGCAPGGTDEAKANARLIAAAPELKEELIEAHQVIRQLQTMLQEDYACPDTARWPYMRQHERNVLLACFDKER